MGLICAEVEEAVDNHLVCNASLCKSVWTSY